MDDRRTDVRCARAACHPRPEWLFVGTLRSLRVRRERAVKDAGQVGTIASSGQHHLEMPTSLTIYGQSVRCQIHCGTCQLY